MERNSLAELLGQALSEQGDKKGRDVIYAAPLANRIKELIRVRLRDDNVEFDGLFFGPVLYPNLTRAECAKLKFRDFLLSFPEQLDVFPTASGDRVHLLNGDRAGKRDEQNAVYKSMLIDALQELTSIREDPNVPLIQLSKWLQKKDPEFDIEKLGFAKFINWLESFKGIIEVSDRESGGKVRFLDKDSTAIVRQENDVSKTGYLLVDSVDLMNSLHRLIGSKPTQSQLPDWGVLLQYVRNRWPALEWKAIYFMALNEQQLDSTEGFRSYLEATGYRVPTPFKVDTDTIDFEQTLKDRAAATALGTSKMLRAILPQDAHVIVVSHNQSIASDLSEILNRRQDGSIIALLTIPELLPDQLARLKYQGLGIVDLEKDVHAFKQALPRQRLCAPEDFDPTLFL